MAAPFKSASLNGRGRRFGGFESLGAYFPWSSIGAAGSDANARCMSLSRVLMLSAECKSAHGPSASVDVVIFRICGVTYELSWLTGCYERSGF